ncbi:ABC transporter permease [Candidatus Dependentiae bacterium]|nr:ABC transporter permease [Candidatus Dependentiae bacterium]
MNNAFIIASRVLSQLKRDKKFFISTLLAPFIVIYFLKTFMDTLPATIPVDRYALPITAFVVYFLSFLLCAIVLAQERTQGTLERMFINGVTRTNIMSGYTLGYSFLALLVTIVALGETIYLFNLHYSWQTVLALFGVIWLLSLVSIMFGIFISTFARTEAQIFPFIPLVALPSIFASGLLVDVAKLPVWAQWTAHGLPLYYANNIILKLIAGTADNWDMIKNLGALGLFVIAFLVLASFTFKQTE